MFYQIRGNLYRRRQNNLCSAINLWKEAGTTSSPERSEQSTRRPSFQFNQRGVKRKKVGQKLVITKDGPITNTRYQRYRRPLGKLRYQRRVSMLSKLHVTCLRFDSPHWPTTDKEPKILRARKWEMSATVYQSKWRVNGVRVDRSTTVSFD